MKNAVKLGQDKLVCTNTHVNRHTGNKKYSDSRSQQLKEKSVSVWAALLVYESYFGYV